MHKVTRQKPTCEECNKNDMVVVAKYAVPNGYQAEYWECERCNRVVKTIRDDFCTHD